MHLEGKSSVLLLDVSKAGIIVHSKHLKRIKTLQVLDLAHDVCILVPQVPEKGGNDDSEIEGALEDAAIRLLLLDCDLCLAMGALALSWKRLYFEIAPDDGFDDAPGDW